jgi:hypothetical protein
MRFGETRGNDPDILTAMGVNDHQQAARRSDADSDERCSPGSGASSVIVMA